MGTEASSFFGGLRIFPSSLSLAKQLTCLWTGEEVSDQEIDIL